MKIKIRLSVLILSLVVLASIMVITVNGEMKKIDTASESYKEKLIRFHVLANSDSDADQTLKLKVRDALIEYLQPKLEKSKSIDESENIIKSEYDILEKISKDIILENGYNYNVNIGITYSNFPTKQYSSIVLPAGEYKALKVEIGSAEGKNWWCVMFPPLCFVDKENGVIDEDTDEQLKESLTESEYELITQKDSKKLTKVEVKFKVFEVIDKLLNK